MTTLDRTLAVALPLLAAAGMIWASTVALTLNATSDAVLRLAWAVRPERIETCRDLSPEELAGIPQHMRQARVCEGTTAEYRLTVRDAGGIRLDRIVRGGGLRQDRRLYVFEELPLTTGASVVEVRFDRVTHAASENDGSEDEDEDTDDEDGDTAEDDDNAREQGAVPPRLSLVRSVTTQPREVVLVTYDEARRTLVAIQSSTPSGHAFANHRQPGGRQVPFGCESWPETAENRTTRSSPRAGTAEGAPGMARRSTQAAKPPVD